MELRSKCHPEANGRKPLIGEQQWIIVVPLDIGEDLTLKLGREAFNNFRQMIEQMDIDDVADGIVPPDKS